jgi:hypothetical protein
MSFPSGSLRSGILALKQERYLEAINLLEAFCYCCSLRTDDAEDGHIPDECLLAQVSLVKAYQGSGDLERAIALCQDVTASTHPQVKTWAEQALQVLLNPETQQALPWQCDQILPPILGLGGEDQDRPLQRAAISVLGTSVLGSM